MTHRELVTDALDLRGYGVITISPDYYMTMLGEALLAIHEDNIPLMGTFAWGKHSPVTLLKDVSEVRFLP